MHDTKVNKKNPFSLLSQIFLLFVSHTLPIPDTAAYRVGRFHQQKHCCHSIKHGAGLGVDNMALIDKLQDYESTVLMLIATLRNIFLLQSQPQPT